MARAKTKKNRISVWNWMGTLLLCSIPGVNLIALICFLIFGKNPSKKTFAGAVLLWALIGVIAVTAVLVAFPEELAMIADVLRGDVVMEGFNVAAAPVSLP